MECLDGGTTACQGDVINRLSVTGATRSPRCERHYADYRERVEPMIEEIDRRYPKHAPPDFDPLYAGERWSEEDY